MKYEIVNGKLVFEDLLLNGSNEIDWVALRQIVLISTRFASGRPVEGRPVSEVIEEVTGYLSKSDAAEDDRDEQIKQLEKDLNNANAIIRALEDQVSNSNIKANQWRIKYNEAARAAQTPGQKARP